MKNILVDIAHPGHVHLFRNFISEIKKKQFRVFVTVKRILAAISLLEKYGIDYIDIGVKKDSILEKIFNQLKYDLALRKIIKENNIVYGLGPSISLSHASIISDITSFIFDDDDSTVEPLVAIFGHPFADWLLSPDVLKDKRKKKRTIYYAGYHELAYLHPNRFKPDASVLKEAKIAYGETFFVLRFNAFKAHHDIGVQGLPLQIKRELINLFSKKGKIFITTEREIEPEFSQYQLKISPEKIHSLLYYATMFIGDSQTMTSEAALLGTPSIKCNSFAGKLSVPNEIENKYQLCYSFQPNQEKKMMEKINELLNMTNLRSEWQKRRQKMLAEKIDVTAFMVWFVENYPHSVEIMRREPEYQWRFR